MSRVVCAPACLPALLFLRRSRCCSAVISGPNSLPLTVAEPWQPSLVQLQLLQPPPGKARGGRRQAAGWLGQGEAGRQACARLPSPGSALAAFCSCDPRWRRGGLEAGGWLWSPRTEGRGGGARSPTDRRAEWRAGDPLSTPKP